MKVYRQIFDENDKLINLIDFEIGLADQNLLHSASASASATAVGGLPGDHFKRKALYQHDPKAGVMGMECFLPLKTRAAVRLLKRLD